MASKTKSDKPKKKRYVRTREEIECCDKLYDFIYKEYNVSTLPQYVFMQITSLYKGEYTKNTREPLQISIFDLYDMWQRKMDYLKQTYEYNKTHGKDMYGANRVCYDLAILINKYDSYKRWKEKQNAIHEQEKTFAEQTKRMKAIRQTKSIQTPSENETDISDIIDEI